MLSAFGAKVNHPVGGFDHLEVVFDHQHRVATIHQLMQHAQQLGHVVEMQTRRRFVKDVQSAAGGSLAQLASELNPLRFAARQCRRGLAQLHIIQADVVQRLQHGLDFRLVGKQFQGFLNIEVEHVVNVLAFELNLQGFAVEASPLANLARHPDVGQKVHL
ncbi:hypothetical protein HRbin36_01922 [bacterium HR36]|nr:hypothetical protein HRbin36_01922 [bacterium HR36]